MTLRVTSKSNTMVAYRSVTYFWKYQNNLIPALKTSPKLLNANFKYLPRGETLMNKTKTNSDNLRSFFNQVIRPWNKIPRKLLNPYFSYISMKKDLGHHYRRRITFELEKPENREKMSRILPFQLIPFIILTYFVILLILG